MKLVLRGYGKIRRFHPSFAIKRPLFPFWKKGPFFKRGLFFTFVIFLGPFFVLFQITDYHEKLKVDVRDFKVGNKIFFLGK